jgi:hypothetical protein
VHPILQFLLGSIGLFFIVLAAKAWGVADAIMESIRKEDERKQREEEREWLK